MLEVSTLNTHTPYMTIETLYFHRSGRARQAQPTKPETRH